MWSRLQQRNIDDAADRLRAGGVVAFATETVYGLGANAFDERAVAKVFELKGRPRFDPLIVHVEDASRVGQLVTAFPDAARKLAEVFWPGPLTLVLPKRDTVPDLVTSGLGTVGVRVPGHPMARAMIEASATAIAAPSANRFGGVSPTTAQHVRDEFGDNLPVLDGGACETGVESTVVAFQEDGSAVVLRLGGVTVEAMRQAVGEVIIAESGSRDGAQASPGMLDKHYAPRTPMELVDLIDPISFGDDEAARVGLLLYLGRGEGVVQRFGAVEVLTRKADPAEAAANLFGAMRRLDAAGVRRIVAERAPDTGLGRAINDRLTRASK